jgi:DNA-binding HxlR family transcriptional regulator
LRRRERNGKLGDMATTGYGGFCPVAQALHVVGERWSLLIIRELLCGNYRFSEIMMGLPLIPRSVLAQRLKSLEETGLIERTVRKGAGRGPFYQLTAAGRELEPVVSGLGVWGQRWARRTTDKQALDPVLMMWDMRRGFDVERLPERLTTVSFWYRDVPAKRSRYWLRIDRPEVELCLTNPGTPIDLKVETTIRTMVDVWMGYRDMQEALRSKAIELEGPSQLTRAFPSWLLLNPLAKVPAVPEAHD